MQEISDIDIDRFYGEYERPIKGLVASDTYTDGKKYGYEGINSNYGKFIEKEDAFAYAMEQCGIQVREDKPLDKEFAETFEEWFFSGDWIERSDI